MPAHRMLLRLFVLASLLAPTLAGIGCGPGARYRRGPLPAGQHRVEALLLSGGGNKLQNVRSHLEHLRGLLELLTAPGKERVGITVFASDGDDSAPDLAERDEGRFPDHWLIHGTRLARILPDLRFENSSLPGVQILPARKAALATWFQVMASVLGPGDTLLLYVTDHGQRRRDGATITLWGEQVGTDEVIAWLDELDPGVRVVLWMSQCYSGAFAQAIYADREDLELHGNRCGFFSTLPDRPAWGCFPEPLDSKEMLGHSLRFLQLLRPGSSLGPAHQLVNLTDRTPDLPLSSSQIYLRDLLAKEAARKHMPSDRLVHDLLTEAWARPERFARQKNILDGLAVRLGCPPIRSLLALRVAERRIAGAHSRSQTYKTRWSEAWRGLAQASVTRFQAERPDAKADTLEQLLRNQGLKPLSDPKEKEQQRAALTDRLLADLAGFARKHGDLYERTRRMRDRALQAGELDLRLAVRAAAVQRARLLLEAIAGEVLAEREDASRQALAKLRSCEAWHLPGASADAAPEPQAPPPLEPLDRDLAALEGLQPAWLGVGYAPEDKDYAAEHGLPAGALVVRSVYPGSPAQQAGLKAGDTILGLVGKPFAEGDTLHEAVLGAPFGSDLPLQVFRDGQRLEIVARPTALPDKVPARPAGPAPGQPAPAWDGLRAYRGTLPEAPPVVLFFFATWCGPCKASVPDLLAFEKRTGIPVVAITSESPEDLNTFLSRFHGPLPERLALDPRGLVSDAYRATAFPTFVLIGGAGTVEARAMGASGMRSEGFQKKP